MKKDNAAVIAHINMMQDIIKRMASNSASCKQWCIVTITALIACSGKLPIEVSLTKACLAPLILFCFLDCYYLGLELLMRMLFNDFVMKLNRGENIDSQIFLIGSPKAETNSCERIKSWFDKELNQMCYTLKALFSFSTLPFYLGILLLCRMIG